MGPPPFPQIKTMQYSGRGQLQKCLSCCNSIFKCLIRNVVKGFFWNHSRALILSNFNFVGMLRVFFHYTVLSLFYFFLDGIFYQSWAQFFGGSSVESHFPDLKWSVSRPHPPLPSLLKLDLAIFFFWGGECLEKLRVRYLIGKPSVSSEIVSWQFSNFLKILNPSVNVGTCTVQKVGIDSILKTLKISIF